MGTIAWNGNALDQADICSCTVTGTWAAGNTATWSLNGKDLVITAGTPFTVADIAALIVRAWNSTDRINDATGSSNVGGASIAEFAEIIAAVDATTPAKINFTTRSSRDAGKEFQAYLTRAAAGGSASLGAITSVQAATGKNWWSNPDNWVGGAVPVNDDIAYFANSSVSVTRGLPAATTQIVIRRDNSYTGNIGLPIINTDNNSKPYYEYRPRYVKFNDAGSGSSITHYLGGGLGNGSALCNIHQTILPAIFEIDCNGKPPAADQKVNNLIAPAGMTLNVRKGLVNAADQNAATASVTAINIAGRIGQSADIDVLVDGNASTAMLVNQVGGKLSIKQAAWSTNGITMIGGEITINAPCPSIEWANGTVFAVGTGTIAAAEQNPRAIFDASRVTGTLTITNMTRHQDTTIIDPGGHIVHTNPVVLSGTNFDSVKMDYGFGRSYQVS